MTRLPAAKRREQLLDTATELFAERGYSKTTTAQLAKAAGVTEPIIYRHFESKRELFIALIDRTGETMASLNRTAATFESLLGQVRDDSRRLAQRANDAVTAVEGLTSSLEQSVGSSTDTLKLLLDEMRVSAQAFTEMANEIQDMVAENLMFTTDKIGDTLGLDEISIGSDWETSDAALTLGKQISDRLYLTYAVGLFDAISTVMLRYTLSRQLHLEAQSSSKSQAIDLIWEKELE